MLPTPKIQRGDILVMTIGDPGTLPGETLYRAASPRLQGEFTHAAIATDSTHLIESDDNGVTKKRIEDALRLKKGRKGFLVLRPNLPKENRVRAADFAEKQIGKSYSNAGMVGAGVSLVVPDAVSKLVKKGLPEGPEREAYQCAALVSASYKSTNKPLKVPTHWMVTAPAHLVMSDSVKVVGGRDLPSVVAAPVFGKKQFKKRMEQLGLKAAAAPGLKPFLTKEKRDALEQVDRHHGDPSKNKWDTFLQSAQRKSFVKALQKDPRTDEKLMRHVDQMNRLSLGKPVGTVGQYTIVRKRGGGLACSCPDWRYKRSVAPDGQQDCKHIREFKAMNKTAENEVRESRGDSKTPWFGPHPHAAPWYEGLTYRPPSSVWELPLVASPYHRYMDHRGKSQRLSDFALLQEIGKLPTHKLTTPKARALLDETRARRLSVRSDAPAPVGKPEEPPSELPALLTGLGGSLGLSALAGKSIGKGHDTFADKKVRALRRLLRQKGWTTRVGQGAYSDDLRKVIEVPEGSHQSVFMHEAGHSLNRGARRDVLGKLYGPGMLYATYGLPLAVTAGTQVFADTSFTKNEEERKRKLTKGQIALGVSALPYLPVLAEEAHATARAVSLAKRFGGNRAAATTAARLAAPYGTYLMGLAGPAAGAAYLQLLKKEKGGISGYWKNRRKKAVKP